MTVRTFTFAIDCRQCGSGLEILTYDDMGTSDTSRCHLICPNCGHRWTVTATLIPTRESLWDLHDRRAAGRRTVA